MRKVRRSTPEAFGLSGDESASGVSFPSGNSFVIAMSFLLPVLVYVRLILAFGLEDG
jgi:hypothetical protein